MSDSIDASQALLDLVFLALDHGVNSVSDVPEGSAMQPFVM